ncbi:MAG: helix-turn-helix domain-containing protein, partial [Bacteroidota bacterium]
GIASEAGFSSKSSFNATFKKLKGLTPSQYKKQNLP